ncbi:secreted protein [Candidatus Magnetomorum sp. HK-1]|nr:secreted protein [Candidatus Magnetomorum sp. HK-1]
MNKKNITIIFLLVLLLQAFVHAESIKLDDIVVTASKTEKTLKEDTSNTTVISKDDIQKYHPRDIMDLLQHVPGMTKHMIRAGIGFKTNYFGNLDTSVRHIDDKFVDNANTLILDDYTVVDMKYTYQVDMLEIIVSVNNLTDEKYAEYAKMNGGAYVNGVPVAYPADGRSLIGSLLFKF